MYTYRHHDTCFSQAGFEILAKWLAQCLLETLVFRNEQIAEYLELEYLKLDELLQGADNMRPESLGPKKTRASV